MLRLISAFDVIAKMALIMALIALPFFVFNSFVYVYRKKRNISSHTTFLSKGLLIKSGLAFVISILALWLVSSLSGLLAREEILNRLNLLTDNYSISVNGKIAQNPNDILRALKSLHWDMGHHSHPTKKISVEIFSQSQKTVLMVARDSSNLQEYWVFFPKYITAEDEVGRITTSIFDKY